MGRQARQKAEQRERKRRESADPEAGRAVGTGAFVIAAGAVALSSTLTLAGSKLSYRSLVRRWSVDLDELVSVEAPSTPEPGSIMIRGVDGRHHRVPITDYSDRAGLAAALLQSIPAPVLSSRAEAELRRLRSVGGH